MKVKTVRKFVKFYYSWCVEVDINYQDECKDLFKVACFFESENLQELLVAQEIIPNMTVESALYYMNKYPLKRSDYQVNNLGIPTYGSRQFLNDYCLHFISRNFAKAAKYNLKELIYVRHGMQYRICSFAIDYLVQEKDLGTILDYMVMTWGYSDIFGLFENYHKPLSKSCGFDSQHNTRISDIRETDAGKLHLCHLIGGNLKSTSFDDTSIDSADQKAAAFLQNETIFEVANSPSNNV